MRRREFIVFIGGAAAWPFSARAQQPGGMPRIGLLSVFAEERSRSSGLEQGVIAALARIGLG
jgi:hypothetical protein